MKRPSEINPAALIVTAVLGIVTLGLWAVVGVLFLRGDVAAGKDAATAASGTTLALTGLLATTGRKDTAQAVEVVNGPADPVPVAADPDSPSYESLRDDRL